MIKTLCITLTMAMTGYAAAQEHAEPSGTHDAGQHDSAVRPGESPSHPVITENSTWAGVLVIVIVGGFFLPAAVIGPIARALAPEDEPVTTSHDEPPGSSHHHGADGTQETAHSSSV